ncbi:PaaI family thioesterase [Mangrovicoccus algicola]|uniref:PaaI family thioesterase n=1 Tax=Mangrovicoccus algicola TaxID=2771008 RepID=A0A8J7CYE0_9RHOB|nr:PaaI family thioesterase [Mangrovicoccus algicola]MBE3639462.1 PaaI family thioesterase [Mangrovicoccus algicola]
MTPEPMQVVKQRRDAALKALEARIPYLRFIGVTMERRGDELTALLNYKDTLIGNPMLPALHGGVISGFLECAALIELAWGPLWQRIESGAVTVEELRDPATRLAMPRTIDFTTDFLRAGLPRDAYARARVNRSGRRYASVHVEAWQDNRARLFAQATGHFLMPQDG